MYKICYSVKYLDGGIFIDESSREIFADLCPANEDCIQELEELLVADKLDLASRVDPALVSLEQVDQVVDHEAAVVLEG